MLFAVARFLRAELVLIPPFDCDLYCTCRVQLNNSKEIEIFCVGLDLEIPVEQRQVMRIITVRNSVFNFSFSREVVRPRSQFDELIW